MLSRQNHHVQYSRIETEQFRAKQCTYFCFHCPHFGSYWHDFNSHTQISVNITFRDWIHCSMMWLSQAIAQISHYTKKFDVAFEYMSTVNVTCNYLQYVLHKIRKWDKSSLRVIASCLDNFVQYPEALKSNLLSLIFSILYCLIVQPLILSIYECVEILFASLLSRSTSVQHWLYNVLFYFGA